MKARHVAQTLLASPELKPKRKFRREAQPEFVDVNCSSGPKRMPAFVPPAIIQSVRAMTEEGEGQVLMAQAPNLDHDESKRGVRGYTHTEQCSISDPLLQALDVTRILTVKPIAVCPINLLLLIRTRCWNEATKTSPMDGVEFCRYCTLLQKYWSMKTRRNFYSKSMFSVSAFV
jgi:hypothetical protein